LARIGEWLGEVEGWAEGEAERPNGIGVAVYSELEIMFTCYYVSKSKSWDWDVDD
jgi:hypothetical protein